MQITTEKNKAYIQMGVAGTVNSILDDLKEKIIEVEDTKLEDDDYVKDVMNTIFIRVFYCTQINDNLNKKGSDYDISELIKYINNLKNYYSHDRNGIRAKDLEVIDNISNRQLYVVTSKKLEEQRLIKESYKKLNSMCYKANSEFEND